MTRENLVSFLAVFLGIVLGQLIIWLVRRWWARRLILPKMPKAHLEAFGQSIGIPRHNGESLHRYRLRIREWLQRPGHPE